MRQMQQLSEILDLDGLDQPPQERMLQIFSEACRLFAQHGFDGTSMRDIAKACGISKATLYHYFPDKDAILRPLVMGITRTLHERVAAAVAARKDSGAPARLLAFMTESCAFFEQYRWAFIVSSTVFWTDPKVRQRRQRLEWRDRHEALLREILEDGVRSGAFRIDDVRMAGRMVLGTLNWLPRWYDPKGPLQAVEIAQRFHAMIVGGFAPKG